MKMTKQHIALENKSQSLRGRDSFPMSKNGCFVLSNTMFIRF